MSLKSLILARTLTGTALADMFALAFASDSLKFVTSRSDQEITEAIAALPATKGSNPRITGKMYIALGAAIGAGMRTIRSELGDGGAWDGNILGSFAKSKAEKRAPYLAAHALGVSVFRDTLATADGWLDVAKKTAEKTAEEKKTEKDARDAEKARKAAEEKARVKSELIAAGELVSADSIKSIGKASAGELVSALLTMDIDDETAATLTAMLSARQKSIKATKKAAEKAAVLLAASEVASVERAAAREADLADKPATHATEKTVVGDVYADAA